MASGWSKITGSSRDIKAALYIPDTVGTIVSSTFWDEPEVSLQNGSFAAVTVTDQPVVAAGSLAGQQNGTIAAAAVSTQPTVNACTLSAGSVGSFAGLSISCQPDVEPVTVSAIRNGSIPAVAVSTQPAVTVGTLAGQQQGAISGIGATCQPVIVAGSLSGKQQGSFAVTTAATQPIVAPVTLSTQAPLQNGLFDALMVSSQPVLAFPTISGQQNGLFASTQLQILIGSLSLESLLTLADQLEDEVALLTPTQLQELVRGALTAQGYTTTRAPKIDEIHGRLGLDPDAPLVTGTTSITFGDIEMAMTGDDTQTTVTRQ